MVEFESMKWAKVLIYSTSLPFLLLRWTENSKEEENEEEESSNEEHSRGVDYKITVVKPISWPHFPALNKREIPFSSVILFVHQRAHLMEHRINDLGVRKWDTRKAKEHNKSPDAQTSNLTHDRDGHGRMAPMFSYRIYGCWSPEKNGRKIMRE